MKNKTILLALSLTLTLLLSACDEDQKVSQDTAVNTNTGMAHQTDSAQESDEEIYKKLHSK